MREAARDGAAGDGRSKARLPSLDGLRAISALMVVLGHAGKLIKVGRHMPFGAGIIDVWGPVGVTVFFVISGFLITRLLLDERRQTGTIGLGAFYFRRTFRILPAYWTYLAVVALLASCGIAVADAGGFARALSFTTDYLNPSSWALNHSWSLSVEEQFYLLWPLALLVVGALRARRTALFLVVAAPVARALTYFCAPQLRPAITAMLHLRVDALMIGCWAALELESGRSARVLDFLSRPATALCSAVYCVLAAAAVRHVPVAQVAVGYSAEAFGALAVLLWAIRHPASKAGRFLNWTPLAHLGVISYSLYLWQQLWLSHETATPLWQVPLLLAGAVLCAEASYRFIEAPMLQLRSKLNWERSGRLSPTSA
jgi:peptidoglycan/LPS O-acetylase OafA/YrhL